MTNEQWLNTLPEPIRSAAIANATAFCPGLLEDSSESLGQALTHCFPWSTSPEGGTRWFLIHKTILQQEKALKDMWSFHETQEEARMEALELTDIITPN